MVRAFLNQLIWAVEFGLRRLAQLSWYWWVAAIAVGFACVLLRKRLLPNAGEGNRMAITTGLLSFYVAAVLAVTVLDRNMASSVGVNLDVFGTWVDRTRGMGGMRYELFVNACMLIPIGLLLPAVTGWGIGRTTLVAIAITVTVEALQLLTGRGWFELSDIVLNVFGAVLGYGIYATLRKVNERQEKQPAGKHFRR